MLKRFLKYYKPHTKLFTLDMLASLLVALVGIVYPIITREMLNELIPNKQYRMIVLAGIGLLVLYLVRMLWREHLLELLLKRVADNEYYLAETCADSVID